MTNTSATRFAIAELHDEDPEGLDQDFKEAILENIGVSRSPTS